MKVLITLLMLLSPLLHAQTSSNNEPNDANGDLRYISDDLFIYMHAGPGREFRILGSVSADNDAILNSFR